MDVDQPLQGTINITKMVFRCLLVVVVMVVPLVKSDESQYCTYLPDVSEPPRQPEVPQQYTLRAEFTEEAHSEVDGTQFRQVMYRKWVYDAIGNRIAVKLYEKPYPLHSLILDWNTKQQVAMYVYIEGESNGCYVSELEDASYLFPMLNGAGQGLSYDRIPDPGVPLGILNWNETHYKGKFVERGITSELWEWCGLERFEDEQNTNRVSMVTHWSVPEWNMPIPTDQVTSIPLSYKIVRWGDDINSYREFMINSVLHYEPFIADYTPFIIPDDMYCKYLIPEADHPFPDYSQDTFFSFSLEYRDTGTKFFLWADAWYDFGKKLYRIDHDRNVEPTPTSTTTSSRASRATKDSSTITTTTLLLDYNDGVSFEFAPGTLSECVVSLVNATQGDWASLTGLDHLWADSPSAFFGSDVTDYDYYGERVERYMVVGDWRGVRNDWPPLGEAEYTDWVWQWRFTNKNVSTFSSLGDHVIVERQVPVALRISPYETINKGQHRTLKSRAAYSIYDFEVDVAGKDVEFNGVRTFDAYDCYSANWRDHLRFKLDVTSWPEVVWTPLLTSTFLNGHWQVTLAKYGQVSPIRITRVQTIIEEEDEAWVEFVLLYRHSRIGELDPDLFRNMTPGEKARAYLTEAVNNGDIKYEGEKPEGGSFTILALHGSLSLVVEPECTTTTSTSTTSTTTTTSEPASSPASGPATTTTITTTTTPTTNTHKPGDSTTTPPQNSLTTTTGEPSTSTDQGRPPKTNAMYTPGDLAGLGIGMLLLGFALGAGGTFLVVVKHLHRTVMGWCTKK